MAEPRYPFIVQHDGHPHPARLSSDVSHLLIRVLDLEVGPVEHAQAIGEPVADVVRDLWALCGALSSSLMKLLDHLAVVPGELSDRRLALAISAALSEQAGLAAGAEWERLKQVEERIAKENPWRSPSDRPYGIADNVEVLEKWGDFPQRALFCAGYEDRERCWLTDRGWLGDNEIVAWRHGFPVSMPDGWPGSAPAPEAAAPSPSSGGVDEAGNVYELGGGR